MTRLNVVANGHLEEHSTRAAIDFVRLVRLQLDLRVRRQGPDVTLDRQHRRLARSITPDALRETWPEADLERVLAATAPSAPGIPRQPERATHAPETVLS